MNNIPSSSLNPAGRPVRLEPDPTKLAAVIIPEDALIPEEFIVTADPIVAMPVALILTTVVTPDTLRFDIVPTPDTLILDVVVTPVTLKC
jgi:hypothetical protein